MFSQVSPFLFKAIKIYGVSSILLESFQGVLQSLEIDAATLTYTLAFESLFLLLKSAQIEVPAWAEALQDLF